jgi:dienelactone hydrolase
MNRILLLLACAASAALPQIPDQDRRNTEIRYTDYHFTMASYPSREAWMERAAHLRKQILAASGLLPLPEKKPVNAQVFGRVDRDGYSIEKVLLETYPGFWLGGNLYRPRGRQGPFPGVVSPHGHWSYGRLENTHLGSLPARGINLARQGFVVFLYDMVGYNDTTQLPHARIGGDREDLWSINLLGLQLGNSIRATDFVASLPDVDAKRLAATGASGGGTQTFLLAAVDDRIQVAAPVNMISSIMQGGSQCENAPNLRVGTNNMEIGALAAPRPLLMVAATGDWTKNTPREEFPALQSIYRLMGVERNVESVQFDAPHNYNQQSREAVYAFFHARLLDRPGPVPEKGFRLEQLGDMLALQLRERPAGAVGPDQYVQDRIAEANRIIERDTSPEACRERLTYSILAARPATTEVVSESREKLPLGERLLIGRPSAGDRIPAVWLEPRRPNAAAPPTLLVHPEGAAWALSSSESSDGLVRSLLARGGAVLAIDTFQTGSARAPRDRSKRFFTTFNQTDDANRVQDILTSLEYLRSRTGRQEVNLLGVGIGGVWSLFARALADDRVNLAADLAQFRAATDAEYVEKFFIPGIRKAGDFRAAAVLVKSGKTLLHNASPEFPLVRQDRISDAELLAWLVPEPPAAARRGSRKRSSR